MVKYPQHAAELEQLLDTDQAVWKSFWSDNFDKQNTSEFHSLFKQVRAEQRVQSERMLQILHDIEQPTLHNIGVKAAQAVSILGLHNSIDVLREVRR